MENNSRPLHSALALIVLGLGVAGSGSAGEAQATVLVDTAIVSPDVTVDLSGTTVDDQLVGDDNLAGTVVQVDLGLPDASDINAYYLESGTNDELFSLDITVQVGGLTASRGDVVRYDGANYILEFDASVEGVPDGSVVDAVAIASGDLLLSFDTTVTLGSNTYGDEDLVRFDGSSFTIFFDGSSQGVADSLDLDAAHFFESDNVLILSFDGSGTLGGVPFDDEDAIEYDMDGGTWAISYDGSAEHSGWAGADLDAAHFVPEPGAFLMLVTGAGFLLIVTRGHARA